MQNINPSDVFNATINTSFGSGNSVAMRSIMVDAIQRYHQTGGLEKRSRQDKKILFIQLVQDAAHEAKGGESSLIIDLSLTPAQKDLAARGYKNFLELKTPDQLIAFVENKELKAAVQKIPVIKDTGPEISKLWQVSGTFERITQKHEIMYYPENGVMQKLAHTLGKGIERAKKDIALEMCISSNISPDSNTYPCPPVLRQATITRNQ